MKKIVYLLMPLMATSFLTNCGNKPTQYLVSCETNGVTISNPKATKGKDYYCEIGIDEQILGEGFTLPSTLTSVTSADNPVTDYDYNLKDANKKADFKIPKASIKGNIVINLSVVEPEEKVETHYHRNDSDYTNWKMWLWDYAGGNGSDYEFNGIDDYGVYALYPLSTIPGVSTSRALAFIVKDNEWNKDPTDSPDRMVKIDQLEKDSNSTYHIYLDTGDLNIYINKEHDVMDQINFAKFIDTGNIEIITTTQFNGIKLYKDNDLLDEKTFSPTTGINYNFASEGKDVSFESSYKVEVKFISGKSVTQTVDMHQIFISDDFATQYNYDGELGAIYTSAKTTFRVWSPISSKITLKIYENGTPTSVSSSKGSDIVYKQVNMTKGEKGVFEATVEEDLAGKYYTYTVTNGFYVDKEIVDPYAKSCGVNGLRGMIVDFSKTNPEGFDEIDPYDYDRKALTVYETHIADLTSSETWTDNAVVKKKAKTYEGFIEKGTTYTDTERGKTVKTGFDHIDELGVNAVQILPFFDHDNDEINPTFNWGYNPLNYNCLEGIYSSNPYDGYVRIKEFKNIVKAYHDIGVNIIMDVVYNHVSNAIGSNFDTLMPGYYFRYKDNGYLANGSGCGNETSSELHMMRKFMIDSACFWAKEYKLGGFRFDLMGLHDLDTMEQIVTETKKINPSITIYGEPWTGGTSPLPTDKAAIQANIEKYKGYGAFNDQMRDALIKGGLSEDNETGWVTKTNGAVDENTRNKIQSGILGKVRRDDKGELGNSDTTVNYVTCHDNYTLFDRVKAINKDNPIDDETAKKMAMLANSVVFTSSGTTFMLAGEEFLRTKYGDKNSYNSGYFVNELNYKYKAEHFDMFENYKALIEFKQEQSSLQEVSPTFNVTVSENKIECGFTSANGTEYIVIHVNGYGSVSPIDLSKYTIYLDTIDPNKELSASTPLQAYETLIAYK